jgi:hypothetical protein
MPNDQNILSGIVDELGHKAKGLDPAKVFSEANLKKRRGAFLTCLIAGVLLVLVAMGAAVYVNAIDVNRFESLALEHIDYASFGSDELSIRSFARETIFYISGAQEGWNPQIVIHLGGIALPASGFIPQTFRDHMATVKGWFGSAQAILFTGLGIAALLLWRSMSGKKRGGKSPLSLGGYYLGVGIPLLLFGGIGLWGVLDFTGFWDVLHTTLIPDGIFSAAEPVMQLFPVELFKGYLQPVATTLGLLMAAILVLPMILVPVSTLLASPTRKKSGHPRRKKGSK